MSEQQNSIFSKAELERYSRHLIIPEFNIEGQRKLKNAKVLVVGSGGLGAPLLLYLAAAGVGTIGIVDFDVVDDSNLQRQVLFDVESIGRPKVEMAEDRLLALNPHIQIRTYNEPLTSDNAMQIIADYDIVADGTDNFPTRYLVNDACVLLNKVNIYGSIFRFDGQVSVFNYEFEDGSRGPNYRDLFPEPPPPGLVPSCAEGGVLGVLPGIIGSMQASEVIKVITGIGEPLVGRLFLFDALTFETNTFIFSKDGNNPISGENQTIDKLIDYEAFCGMPALEVEPEQAKIPELSVSELKAMRENGNGFQLVDVREPYEWEIVNIGGDLIPQNDVEERLDEIDRDKKVVVMCRSGVRSAKIVDMLRSKYGYENCYNLKGGVLAWAEEVDDSLPRY